jgi:hypothetical protein
MMAPAEDGVEPARKKPVNQVTFFGEFHNPRKYRFVHSPGIMDEMAGCRQ